MAYRSLLSIIFIFCLDVGAETWSGDLRVRGQSEKKGDDQSRVSERIRVRVGVAAEIFKDLKGEIRLASASGSRSTNQSLGDSAEPGMPRRTIGLDLAYGKWSALPFVSFYAGRFPQIHFAPGGSETLLDDDLALEGVGASGEYEVVPQIFAFGATGSTYIRENYDNYYSADMADNMINFGQLGVKWKRERWQLAVGGGFFNFTSVEGKNFSDLVNGGKANGNSETLTPGVVKYPYLPIQYFVELKMPVGTLDTKLFFEYVSNREAPEQNKAIWLGAEVTQASWDASLAYASIEQDAVLAMFTASDIGDGVTDVQGWLGRLRWKFAKNMNVRLSQWVHRTDMTGLNREYRRTNVDLSVTF